MSKDTQNSASQERAKSLNVVALVGTGLFLLALFIGLIWLVGLLIGFLIGWVVLLPLTGSLRVANWLISQGWPEGTYVAGWIIGLYLQASVSWVVWRLWEGGATARRWYKRAGELIRVPAALDEGA